MDVKLYVLIVYIFSDSLVERTQWPCEPCDEGMEHAEQLDKGR